MSLAAKRYGIPPKTVSNWWHKGCDDIENNVDSPLAHFAEKVEYARVLNVERQLNRIDAAAEGGQVLSEEETKYGTKTTYAKGDWKAADRLLTIADPYFMERKQVEHTGTIQHNTLVVNVTQQLEEAGILQLAHAVANVPKLEEKPAPAN